VALRIAHFIQRYPPARGGSEAYFARLGKYLVRAGHQVTVFTSAALDLEAFWSKKGRCLTAGTGTEDGIRVRRYGLIRWPARRYVLKFLSFLPNRLWQCLTLPCNPICPGMWRDAGRPDQDFDLVHATAFPYAWPIACGLRLARRLRIPFLLTPFLHLGDPDDPHDATHRAYTTPALLSLIRAADRVFVQTESERAELERCGIQPGKIVLQGLGVEPAECTGGDREKTRRAWGIKPAEVVVGHLANNSREKGSVDLLLAVQKLWQRGVPVRMVLAGPQMPNFLKFWESFSQTLPNPDAVLRLGEINDSQKIDFLAGLDIFALPSRSDSFGLVLLEAWASGLPNVGYRAGGVADVIRHERDGLLVRCGDIDGLADGLVHLIEDGDLRRRFGNAGRDRLPIEFRWQDKLDLVQQTYESCLRLAFGVSKRTLNVNRKLEI
jgi:glycosyltransferase involved in cell wall biosynthesis